MYNEEQTSREHDVCRLRRSSIRRLDLHIDSHLHSVLSTTLLHSHDSPTRRLTRSTSGMFGLACARVARRAPPAVAYLHSTAPFTTAASLAPRRLHVSASIIALGKTSPVTAPPTTASLRFTQVRGYAEGGRKETNEELLDRLTREAKARGRAFDATHEHVGPFPLGVGPSGRNKTWTRWGDLGLGGKCEYPKAGR